MYILSTSEMKNIDRRAIEKYGISSEDLMENAGKAVAKGIQEQLAFLEGIQVLVVCGKGNNGGDGFVVARHLFNMGAVVSLVMCCDEKEISKDALTMRKRLPKKVFILSMEKAMERKFDVAIDAIFGTGYNGAATGVYADGIKLVCNSAKLVISIDIPSGLYGDTGSCGRGPYVKADITYTLCCEKLVHRMPSRSTCGRIIVCDIGIPKEAIIEENPECRLFTSYEAKMFMRDPSPYDHKGTNGKILIVGGSEGMAGSVCMAAMGAMRSGVGLCYVAVPRCIYSIVAAKLTEAIIIPLDDENGKIAPSAAKTVIEKAYDMDAVAIGCGMGECDGTAEFLKAVLEKLQTATLLDADGLNILAKHPNMKRNTSLVLTPHPGEIERLMGMDGGSANKNRMEVARNCAKKYDAYVVLKGYGTITTSGGEAYINSTGNPGMAKGGSGDVLTGVIGAQLARGILSYYAAAFGVYIHGLAGDKAAAELSMAGMIATDIISHLPHCFTY